MLALILKNIVTYKQKTKISVQQMIQAANDKSPMFAGSK